MGKGLHYWKIFLMCSFPIWFKYTVIRSADNSNHKNGSRPYHTAQTHFSCLCPWLRFRKKLGILAHPLNARGMAVRNLTPVLGKGAWVREREGGTYQPTLNSTWASKRATTGAVAALQPLTRERISPSCLLCRTTLMKPGLWAFTSSTYFCSFSFSSSAAGKEGGVSLARCKNLFFRRNSLHTVLRILK